MRCIRSAHRKKNHVIVIVQAGNEDGLKTIQDAVRLLVRKLRKQLDGGLSFEVYGRIEWENDPCESGDILSEPESACGRYIRRSEKEVSRWKKKK